MAVATAPDQTLRFRDPEEAQLFVQYRLSDEAGRAPANHQKKRPEGIYTGYDRRPFPGFRGSDRTERIYVSVLALTSVGMTQNDACVTVAEMLEDKLGRSRRGRPVSSGSQKHEFVNRVQTVRSIFNHHSRRHLWPLAWYVERFLEWGQWVLSLDEATLAFFVERVQKDRGIQSARRFRDAVLAFRQTYADSYWYVESVNRLGAAFWGAGLVTKD